jgi:hypothetical protein
MWEFDDVRVLAIKEMEPLCGPVDKIVLAKKYDIAVWLIPAYTALCIRPAPLCVEEGAALGTEAVTKLAQARERYRTDWCPGCNRRAFAQKSQGYDPTQIVVSIFSGHSYVPPSPSVSIINVAGY